MLLPIHIAAGGLALVLGAVAPLVKKGGTLHRRSGLLFVLRHTQDGTFVIGGSGRPLDRDLRSSAPAGGKRHAVAVRLGLKRFSKKPVRPPCARYLTIPTR